MSKQYRWLDPRPVAAEAVFRRVMRAADVIWLREQEVKRAAASKSQHVSEVAAGSPYLPRRSSEPFAQETGTDSQKLRQPALQEQLGLQAEGQQQCALQATSRSR